MGKRGYKLRICGTLSDVNCVRVGKKACRLLLTGGDDHIVNLWTIGNPNSLMSLRGHTTPVESLAFDSTEMFVLGGATSGTVKLWDLEEAKMIRTLTGHRSNCTAVEFHPFGEFFASGSADTNLKIWDIRKRRCNFTYKGHDLRINTIKFSPDGRWLVSAGFDNVVKVWDLTAGKLLHDLKSHNRHIRSIDFHPLELLLATGSADRTVNFWDLETFEMIGSTKPEAKGVRAITFHSDGRALFCGYDNNLKVYSWEPMICHDTIDMGWSTLGDLCINEGKLIGCSYYHSSIGVWVADLSHTESKLDRKGRQSSDIVGPCAISSSGSRSSSPESDAKDIKNIYVDYEKPVNSQSTGFLNNSKPLSSADTKDIGKLPARKQCIPNTVPGKSNDSTSSRSFFGTNFVPREIFSGKNPANSRRESLTFSRSESRGSVKADDMISNPNKGFDVDLAHPKFFDRIFTEDGIKKLAEDTFPTVEKVAEKPQEIIFPSVSSSLQSRATAHGRTRCLVEKFERKGQFSSSEDPVISAAPEVIADRINRSTTKEEPQVSGRESKSVSNANVIEDLMQNHDVLLSDLRSRLTGLQMVRHLWERNDIKGAVNALRKLSDQSVHADVIGVLMERMEIVTMDLFSCMLPILAGLLDSKLERHAKMSLDMLLKLVVLFGPTISSTISAIPPAGLDLHREERIECCKQCFTGLHQIQGFLPVFARRGGSLAKSALKLRLLLQDHNM